MDIIDLEITHANKNLPLFYTKTHWLNIAGDGFGV